MAHGVLESGSRAPLLEQESGQISKIGPRGSRRIFNRVLTHQVLYHLFGVPELLESVHRLCVENNVAGWDIHMAE
jgi:hypothetical protein